MTSSNSNGPRLPRWLVECGLNTWDILRAARYGELRQENERRIRQKIEDNKIIQGTIQEIKESIDKFKKESEETIQEANKLTQETKTMTEKNEEIIQEIKQKTEKSIEEANKLTQETKTMIKKSEETIQEAKQKTEELIKESEEKLEGEVTEAIRGQIYNIKAYKSMESELRKLQAGVILIPVFLVAFSVFFGDRIKDIMSIDVLQAEIKSLQEDVKSLRSTQGKGAYPHGLPPWDESQSHCSDGGIFPDC